MAAWWNGRHSRLKICFWETGVPVRVRARPPIMQRMQKDNRFFGRLPWRDGTVGFAKYPAAKQFLHLQSAIRELDGCCPIRQVMRPEGCKRQRQKIAELEDALIREGYSTLDAQAAALGLRRSTTWAVLRAAHKASGLSASVVIQMLSARQLPHSVWLRIFEYVIEKIDGSYGHKRKQIHRFIAGLDSNAVHLGRAAREVYDFDAAKHFVRCPACGGWHASPAAGPVSSHGRSS